jgi:branched-chain amino acid transport system substrate-binding protein
MIDAAAFRPKVSLIRLFAILGLAAIAAFSACTPPPPPPPKVVVPPAPVAGNPLDKDLPTYFRLPNTPPDSTPVRVGIILPFSSTNAGTRNLAAAMLKSAELALFDGGNANVLLITADEGAGADTAGAAAAKLVGQGAEIIIGPLFGPSVTAVAPIARDRGIPVLAFSTERSVAGNGIYLLSFLPQSEVKRVVNYAVSQGHHNFAAMVPQTPYGDVISTAFNDAVKNAGATTVMAPSAVIAKSNADVVMIAQGGSVLRAIAPSLAFNGLDPAKVKLLGTGLWDDANVVKEQSLTGGWFAAPEPNADNAFNEKYRAVYGAAPPQLASLAYDAVSLVALLSNGTPYHRFTPAALMDPNGFGGVNGIFRFNADGTSERGLAVLEVQPDGFHVASPAPKTFQSSSF